MMVTHSVEMVLQSYEESLCIEIEKIYINEENILKLLEKEKSLIFLMKKYFHLLETLKYILFLLKNKK